jgi:hypothetical protein
MEWPEREVFEASFRATARRTPNDALCVLDVAVANIGEFEQGRLALVLDEFAHAAVPPAAARRAAALLAEHCVSDALRMRRELINFKKVMLHVHAAVVELDRELRRAAAVLYCKLSTACAVDRERYSSVAAALAGLQGVALAASGGRRFTKAVCTIHRHPDAPRGGVLRSLPRALPELKAVRSALRFVAAAAEGSGGTAARADAVGAARETARRAGAPRWAALRDAVRAEPGWPPHAARFVESVLVARGVSKALTMVDELEGYGAALALLPTRVAAARAELAALCAAAASPDAKRARPALAHGVSETSVHASRHMRILEGANDVGCDTLRWVQTLLSIVTAPNAAATPRATLFLGGDGVESMTVPRGFVAFAALARARSVALGARDAVAERIVAAGAWPPPLPAASGTGGAAGGGSAPEWAAAVVGTQGPCLRCDGRFTCLFLEARTGVCTRCATEMRAEGRCPGESRRGAKRPHPARGVWCAHARRCFACDRHSCASCRLWRCADGVAASELVADALLRHGSPTGRSRGTKRAHVTSEGAEAGGDVGTDAAGEGAAFTLLLDFDRTLCTTRSGECSFMYRYILRESCSQFDSLPLTYLTISHSGNPPVVGRHRIESGLVALAARAVRSGGSVAIVTRNGNFDAIRAFLAARMPLPGGVERLSAAQGGVAIRCVKREGVGKGDVVREALEARRGLVVFVDDDLAEHVSVRGALRDDGAAAERLLRVHFCP